MMTIRRLSILLALIAGAYPTGSHAAETAAPASSPIVQAAAPESPADTAHPSGAAAPAAASADAATAPADSGNPGGNPAREQEEAPTEKVVVQGRRAVTASNSQVIRDRDLKLRVMTDPSDVIKVTPGLFTGQHAGGGKANQFFIRGFDADHGTDISLWFDGMPINNVSHGHGQGYSDLHFIIPELVDKVEVFKGPYNVEYGNLATAAAVRMNTRQNPQENQVYVSAGMHQTYRVLDIMTLNTPSKPVLAAEVYRSDAPFDNPEDMERYNLYLKTPLVYEGPSRLSMTMMAYQSGWHGSGQVPLRAVESDLISKWGSIDPTEGGNSQRQSLSLDYASTPSREEQWKASAYLINYRLSMFSNFTFFAEDSVNGDQINQRDDRLVGGFNGTYQRKHSFLGMGLTSLFGVSARNDLIRNNLDHSAARRIFSRQVDADVREMNLGAFYQEGFSPHDWLYFEIGVRGDHFGFDVVDNLHPTGDSSLTGSKDAGIISPKVNVVITPHPGFDIFLNYGEGFHSNDARGVVSPVDPARTITKARGYETGARTRLWDRLDLAASLWLLDMDGELVWSGDGGTTEEKGPTRRLGVDFETRFEILDWLWADMDLTRSRATYTKNAGNGNAVALAPRLTVAGGISAQHSSGLFGSLRAQHLDDRPADEAGTFTAKGFTEFDLAAGIRHENVELQISVVNLFDTDWRSAQFENDSRMQGEPATVTDMHIVPGSPITLTGGVKVFF